MPILQQHRIYRCDLQNNPEVLYLFGDNWKQVGLGGQAKEMRGEPNAFGIATKFAPGNLDEDFFKDALLMTILPRMNEELIYVAAELKKDRLVVLPSDGLGTGLSELPTRAPIINSILVRSIQSLKEIKCG